MTNRELVIWQWEDPEYGLKHLVSVQKEKRLYDFCEFIINIYKNKLKYNFGIFSFYKEKALKLYSVSEFIGQDAAVWKTRHWIQLVTEGKKSYASAGYAWAGSKEKEKRNYHFALYLKKYSEIDNDFKNNLYPKLDYLTKV